MSDRTKQGGGWAVAYRVARTKMGEFLDGVEDVDEAEARRAFGMTIRAGELGLKVEGEIVDAVRLLRITSRHTGKNLFSAVQEHNIGVLAREAAREDEALAWYGRWLEATGQGDEWADVEAEEAVLARVCNPGGVPRGTTVEERRRVGRLLSGARLAFLRAAAEGRIEIEWSSCPALSWLEAVARLERTQATRSAAHAASAAFEALRRGDLEGGAAALRVALAELGEDLRPLPVPPWEALEDVELR